jgi:hypothetical protein
MRWLGLVAVVLVVVGTAQAEWELHVNSNGVTSLYPDDDGLWWGSSGGAVFRSGDAGTYAKFVRSEDGLRSNEVSAVLVDSTGNIWLGTEGDGVCILQTDTTWRFINTQTLGLLSDDVLDISDCGNLVAVGTAGGVTVFENGVFDRFYNGIDWGSSGCDSAIAVSCDGTIMLVGTQCGLQRYDFGSGLWSTVLPDYRIVDIDYDGDSLFWAVSDDSIFTYDGESLERVPKTLIRFEVMRGIAALDTTVWAATQRGPVRYDAANESWYFNRTGIPDDLWDGTAIAIDTTGTVYTGTYHGAAELVGDTWEMREAPGPYGNYIHDIAVDGKDRVWCTTGYRFSGAPLEANKGVYVYDGANWDRLDGSVLPSPIAYPIDASPYDGSVWIGFWDGANGDLLQYDMADTGFTSYQDLLESRVISAIHAADGGEVLFTQYTGETSFGVLYNFYSSFVYYGNFDDPLCVASPFLLALGSGGDRCYLTGSYNSPPEGSPPEIVQFCPGLSWSSKTDDTCTTWGPLDGWPQGHVYALTTDPYGVMWCGTSAGLGSYDGSWHTVRSTIGVVWDIAVDGNGTKWIASDEGLYELQGEGSLWSDFEGRRIHYDESNSLLPDRAVKAVDVAADGSLWIGTAGGGVYSFMPDEPRRVGGPSAWVQAYPSPYNEWKEDFNAPVRFAGCKPDARVRIYALDGTFVAEVGCEETWDMRNQKGKEVVSGVYIFHTYAEDGSEFIGRIVVIR